MNFKKIVIIGGGVLGTQIALISAYTGHDTTLWMRSEGTIGRTKPRLARYQEEIWVNHFFCVLDGYWLRTPPLTEPVRNAAA